MERGKEEKKAVTPFLHEWRESQSWVEVSETMAHSAK
jgi:hypothetical protein